jgi:hypothetical protein
MSQNAGVDYHEHDMIQPDYAGGPMYVVRGGSGVSGGLKKVVIDISIYICKMVLQRIPCSIGR